MISHTTAAQMTNAELSQTFRVCYKNRPTSSFGMYALIPADCEGVAITKFRAAYGNSVIITAVYRETKLPRATMDRMAWRAEVNTGNLDELTHDTSGT